ncbi:DUF2188 domain-containing protein [Yersinia proxima]|uniref:DUF2188 domain-containing protein n=1 Tax=Yersinia proxima TaxID=2890316 RepID=UPI003D68747A
MKGEGNGKATSVHRTQQEAIDAGRGIAKNEGSGLVIHRPNSIPTIMFISWFHASLNFTHEKSLRNVHGILMP